MKEFMTFPDKPQKKYKLTVFSGIYFPLDDLFRLYLDSCVKQTLDDIEFVFIIDHPNDIESEKILNEYKEKFYNSKHNFRIFKHDKNIGLSNTYIEGLTLAQGDYIVFLDDDDFFDSDYLEKMYNYISQNNYNIIRGNSITCYLSKIDIRHVFTHNKNINLDDWLFMYKRDALLKDLTICATFSTDKLIFDNTIPKLPLQEGTFYHHTRNANNTSNAQSNKFDDNKINQEAANYKKLCKITLLNILKRYNIDLSCYNNEEELLSIIKKYTNLDQEDNNFFNYDIIRSFDLLDEKLQKIINIYIYQIQALQLNSIKIHIHEFDINDINKLRCLVNFIKFYGILNRFTFIIDYDIIDYKDVELLQKEFIDLNIEKYENIE